MVVNERWWCVGTKSILGRKDFHLSLVRLMVKVHLKVHLKVHVSHLSRRGSMFSFPSFSQSFPFPLLKLLVRERCLFSL